MARTLKTHRDYKRRSAPRRKPSTTRRKASTNSAGARWSAGVTRDSDALDLDPSVFKLRAAKSIARSLKRSAERSKRRKSSPYRSAVSMLVFYINRAGKNLTPARRNTLEQAKDELRSLFGKDEARGRPARSRG
jgi:Protein of unknown function (DUF3175)